MRLDVGRVVVLFFEGVAEHADEEVFVVIVRLGAVGLPTVKHIFDDEGVDFLKRLRGGKGGVSKGCLDDPIEPANTPYRRANALTTSQEIPPILIQRTFAHSGRVRDSCAYFRGEMNAVGQDQNGPKNSRSHREKNTL